MDSPFENVFMTYNAYEGFSPWRPIETCKKIEGELIMLACADWPPSRVNNVPIPRKLGAWLEGKWEIPGASWQPTHWCHIPPAPALVQKHDSVLCDE